MIVTGAEPEDVFVSPETETGMNVSFTGYKYYYGIIFLMAKIQNTVIESLC